MKLEQTATAEFNKFAKQSAEYLTLDEFAQASTPSDPSLFIPTSAYKAILAKAITPSSPSQISKKEWLETVKLFHRGDVGERAAFKFLDSNRRNTLGAEDLKRVTALAANPVLGVIGNARLDYPAFKQFLSVVKKQVLIKAWKEVDVDGKGTLSRDQLGVFS